MTYQVLARKWRPQGFGEVIGQSYTTRALQNAVQTGKISQAYLFSGPRGVGKTTMARILAKALNCQQGPTPNPCNQCSTCQEIAAGTWVDVLEVDGASNTGVDNVRELREGVKYTPLQGKYKVYVIDEVHMLSTAAFNALLKTLEEPPAHMVFILATTEPHKIPMTVRSRCQHFQFRRITRKDVVAQLREVTAKENVQIGERELFMLARGADGSMRDALSLLDQAMAYGDGEVKAEDLSMVMGTVERQKLLDLLAVIREADAPEGLAQVRALVDQGHDLRQFCHELVEVIRDLTMMKLTKNPEALVECPPDEMEELRVLAQGFSPERLQWLFKLFAQTYDEIKYFFYPPFLLEMAVVQATQLDPGEPISEVLEKVEALAKKLSLNGGGQMTAPASLPSALPAIPPDVSPGVSKDIRQEKPDTPSPARSVEPSGPSKAAVSEVSAQDAPEQWKALIQEIRSKRPPLASYLEQSVFLGLSGDELRIAYAKESSVFKDLIQRGDDQAMITGLIKTFFGRALKLRVDSLTGDSSHLQPKAKEVDPMVKEALRVLGGEILESES